MGFKEFRTSILKIMQEFIEYSYSCNLSHSWPLNLLDIFYLALLVYSLVISQLTIKTHDLDKFLLSLGQNPAYLDLEVITIFPLCYYSYFL